MAERRKRTGRTVFEVAQKRRKSAEERNKTRVILGESFTRWRALKTQIGLSTDAAVAKVLLDSYENRTENSSNQNREQVSPSASSASEPETGSGTESESNNEKKPLEQLQTTSRPPSNKAEQTVTSGSPQEETASGAAFGPALKCPSCGFVLLLWLLQNKSILDEVYQPQSIEVTLEPDQSEETVSCVEEEDQSEEEEEEEEEEDSDDESEGSGVDLKNGRGDWTPEPRRRIQRKKRKYKTAADEADPKKKNQLCTECGKFYKKRHKCNHKTKPFACNDCGRRFISEPALKIHSHIHMETHEFHCKFCSVSFKTKVDKLAHELIHLQQNDPFKCPHCALTFPSFKKRLEHLKTLHREQSQHKCPICGIEYRSKDKFMRHIVVHTGERPFKCSDCDMSFKQESHLKSHVRLHTGERPYGCKHCPKAFNHNVSLKSHVQKYHPQEEEEKVKEEEKKVKEEEEKVKEEDDREETHEQVEDGETAKYKWRTPHTGRPVGRPKRSVGEKKKNTRRKRLKTQESDEEEEEEEEEEESEEDYS